MNTLASSRFSTLDDLSAISRYGLIALCGLICCWGFVQNSALLVLAAKVGFPFAVVLCAVLRDKSKVADFFYYTLFLVMIAVVFYTVFPVTLEQDLTKLFVPTPIDAIIAVGLGLVLSGFWDHHLRTNVIVMAGATAYLLPACIMAGYFFQQANWSQAAFSLILHVEYAAGIIIGTWLHQVVAKNT